MSTLSRLSQSSSSCEIAWIKSAHLVSSNWFDLEVQRNQAEHKSLKVLNEVIEDTKAFRIVGFSNIHEGSDFSGLMPSVNT